jgi:hypothetical protein
MRNWLAKTGAKIEWMSWKRENGEKMGEKETDVALFVYFFLLIHSFIHKRGAHCAQFSPLKE